jgi:HAD superfamily hydrolase (TIGR01662 family)
MNTLLLPKYKAVIFDLDDTLLESREVKWAHHKAVAKKFYNLDLTDEDIREHWGKPFHVLVSELYQHKDTLDNLIAANVAIREEFRKKVYPGAVEVVKEIIKNGVKVGILSAATKKFFVEDLERFNFPVNQFAFIQDPEDTTVHKPNPKVFLPALDKLSKLGIKKEEIVYVGDSIDDLRAAHGAGIDFIAVTTGLYAKDDFKKHNARVIIKEISEVLEYLLR